MKNLWMIKFSKKLDNQWVEFFKIKKIMRKQAYQLKLLKCYKLIHSTFHVSLLESYWQQFRKKLSESFRKMINNHIKWVVKKILDRWLQWEKVQYFIKWDEYSDSENTWKLTEYLKTAQQLDIYKTTKSAIKTHSRCQNFNRQMRRR